MHHQMDTGKKEIALVLSSGGARGIAHIGVIEGLEAAGFKVHAVAGCSMGAVVGGLYAAGKLKELKEWLCDLDKMDVFKLFDFTISSKGFIKGEKVFNELRSMLDDCNIEDLLLPYSAVAVDIRSDEEVVFSKGSLFEAMRASAAIPSIVTPVKTKNGLLVDGGVLNPIPLDLVNRKEGDLLVGVDVNARGPYTPPEVVKEKQREQKQQEKDYRYKVKKFMDNMWELWPGDDKENEKEFGLLDLVTKSMDLMQDKLSDVKVDLYPPDLLVKIPRAASGTFEFYRAAELVEIGRMAFEKAHKEWQP
jgi:NTE family protein